MSKSMKVSIIYTIAWGLISVCMIVIFSLPNTISNWGENPIKTVVLSALFLLGFLTNLFLRLYEKSKKHGFKKDERDKKIQADAIFKSLSILLVYIFLLCVALYLFYENTGTMPIGWVWFIAYSQIAVVYFLVSLFSVIGYKKQGM